jgi:hypothetical protein
MKTISSRFGTTHISQRQEKFLAAVSWQTLATAILLWLIFAATLAFIHFVTPNLAGNDDYFHIRFAEVMRLQGLRPHFPWLEMTILNSSEYYDHHFLYHVLLIPFTYGDLLVGAKLAGVIFPACAFVMGWVVLRGQGVLYPALWALGFLALSEAFISRMVMTRVQSVSLFMLFLMLHVTLKERYRWLLPLAFIYTWLYDAFPLLLTILALYVAARWLLDRQFHWQPLFYAVLGVVLGSVINPYFPHNVIFIYHHFLPKLVDVTDSNINVGNEWYPYETWSLVENSALSLFAFAAGAFALGFSGRKMSGKLAFLFLVALLFGGLLFKSRRFIEYYPAFVLLFCAVAWKPIFDEWRQNKPWLNKILPAALLLIFMPAIWLNVWEARDDMEDSTSHERYAAASAWLQANTLPGSRIFQTDWDDFSRLYYHNTYNTYTIGLDPTYMHLYDPELYQVWRGITRGLGENLGGTIRHTFNAEYAITDLNHDDFMEKVEWENSMREVYRDEYAAIYRVVD